jgi:hypothetical protein
MLDRKSSSTKEISEPLTEWELRQNSTKDLIEIAILEKLADDMEAHEVHEALSVAANLLDVGMIEQLAYQIEESKSTSLILRGDGLAYILGNATAPTDGQPITTALGARLPDKSGAMPSIHEIVSDVRASCLEPKSLVYVVGVTAMAWLLWNKN